MERRDKINDMDEHLELRVVTPIYKPVMVETKGEDGKITYEEDDEFVKNVITLHLFSREDLRLSQYINKKLLISKKKSVIFDRVTQKSYVVTHPYEEVKQMLAGPEKTPMGFKKTN